MKFLRVIRYLVRYTGNYGKGMPTGEIDEQNLIYERIEGGLLKDTWQLRYDCFHFSASGHTYENERINVPLYDPLDPYFNSCIDKNPVVRNAYDAIEIMGGFTYEGDDYLKDNFEKRFALKQMMQRGLQEIFDAARLQIDNEIKQLTELRAKYEHLPVRG